MVADVTTTAAAINTVVIMVVEDTVVVSKSSHIVPLGYLQNVCDLLIQHTHRGTTPHAIGHLLK
jgi:hypothetical protein